MSHEIHLAASTRSTETCSGLSLPANLAQGVPAILPARNEQYGRPRVDTNISKNQTWSEGYAVPSTSRLGHEILSAVDAHRKTVTVSLRTGDKRPRTQQSTLPTTSCGLVGEVKLKTKLFTTFRRCSSQRLAFCVLLLTYLCKYSFEQRNNFNKFQPLLALSFVLFASNGRHSGPTPCRFFPASQKVTGDGSLKYSTPQGLVSTL